MQGTTVRGMGHRPATGMHGLSERSCLALTLLTTAQSSSLAPVRTEPSKPDEQARQEQ